MQRKLVWEILDNGLKKNIEILWHDISNIQALLPEKGLGILKIMVYFLISIFSFQKEKITLTFIKI